MGFERVEELFAFINQEERHVNTFWELRKTSKTSVACGDPLLNSKSSWKPVGGAAYLYINGILEEYVQRRAGKSGTLEAHLACGWMFTKGFQTYERQSGLIVAARQVVEELNNTYGASFNVPEPSHVGSAAPFMIGSPYGNYGHY